MIDDIIRRRRKKYYQKIYWNNVGEGILNGDKR